MADKLVIVESPTKAKTIGKMLGSSYKVLATVGHLRDLPKSKIGVDIDNNFEPQYINVRGKADKIKELKKASKSVKKIYLATDPDREGEAISWHLSNLLDLDLQENNRVEFNEITKDFVKEAIKKPRKIDLDLVDAQQARRVLDRIVGYKLSPVLWKKIKNGLSAGRVQSVALKLICDREKEIEGFIPQEYWSIVASHQKDKIKFDSEYYAKLVDGKEIKCPDMIDKKLAVEVESSIDKNNFKVLDISKKNRSKNPYPPFTTSTLQQEANKRLGFSTHKTMSVAQSLYEGVFIGQEGTVGLISYMRTDSTRLSSLILNEAKQYIEAKYGKSYSNGGLAYDKKKSGSQDAHEAVRPSSILRSPELIKEFLSKDQFALYNLIWTRTLQSQMKAAIYEITSIKLESNSYLFKSTGNLIKFDGFMKVWTSEEKENQMPKLGVNEVVKTSKVEKLEHFTKAKPRFTEASLVKALEEDGIGRPSTYSSIIRSLMARDYVRIEKKYFFPTEIGLNVNELLAKHFSAIINEEFTAEMENKLDEIADKEYEWKKVISDFYLDFEKLLEKAGQEGDTFKVKDKVLDELCPECGRHLLEKHGRNGKFIGCSGFPECKFTKAIVKGTGIKCPKCGSEIIEKISKKGKLFFGCSNYPKCDFAMWDRPTEKVCPKCSSMLGRKKNRYGEFLVCTNEECKYEEKL